VRSKVVERIKRRTKRRTKLDVKAYAKLLLFGARQRFYAYFSWKQFNIGIGFCKTIGLTGWKYMLSIDIAQISMWIYFKKL
jgi:hypothetical protein